MSGDFQIGEWRIQPAVNRVSRGDHVVRLEPKVMHVLVCLAERAGEVVTREELLSRVWADVFVTDDVLHRAVRELRRVFGDSTTQPAYIETIRKRGYRLMVPIAPAEADAVATALDRHDVEAPVNAPLDTRSDVQITRSRWPFSLVAAGVGVAIATSIVILASRTHETAPEAHARFVPVVSGPLNESDPAMSADGRYVAFVQRELGDSSPADIYIRDLTDRRVTRVTDHPASDRMPTWSPDGSRLAFIRADAASCAIFIRSLSTGVDSMIAACANRQEPRMAWTRDGRALLTSRASNQTPTGWQLVRLDIAAGTFTPITTPPPGIVGDHSPAVSPDGRHVAFIRRTSGGVSDVFVSAIDGTQERRLTFDESDLMGVDWTSDGKSLAYSSDRAGGYTLWRVPLAGGSPTLLAGGAARLKHPVGDRGARRVVYENWNYDINIGRVRLGGLTGGGAEPPVEQVTRTSELWNLYPQISPDGSRMAYVSTQSGSHELWIADPDGVNGQQLTHLGGGVVKMPRWSPDGRRVVFLARGERSVDVYVVDVVTGAVSPITSDTRYEVAPAWSADGTRIMFGATDADGSSNVWSVNAADPADVRIEIRNAVTAQTSVDGKLLYFTRSDQPGVWRVRTDAARSQSGIDAGQAERVIDDVETGNTQGWLVASDAIYFVEDTDEVRLKRVALSGGEAIVVAMLPQFSWPGFSVSRDGSVFYARWDRRESNLMSIEY